MKDKCREDRGLFSNGLIATKPLSSLQQCVWAHKFNHTSVWWCRSADMIYVCSIWIARLLSSINVVCQTKHLLLQVIVFELSDYSISIFLNFDYALQVVNYNITILCVILNEKILDNALKIRWVLGAFEWGWYCKKCIKKRN